LIRKTLYLAAGVSVAMVALTATVPADANGSGRSTARGIVPVYKTVASGLHAPRQIVFSHGAMYVAEAGQGGNGTCISGGEGPSCYGATGSVTRVRDGKQRRVLKALASLSNQADQSSPIGPSDLAVVGRHTLVLSFGLGSAPKNRKSLPKLGRQQLGHVLSFNLGTKKFTSAGDLAAHEAKTNPIANKDSDPTGLLRLGKKGWLATDSGGNTLVRIKNGTVRTRAVFKNRMGTSPVTGPNPVEFQAVPTDVVKGPDGAFYISELTGFPFIEGAARIYRMVPGHRPKVWASGLTNVTSMTWDGNKLYAVQISDQGLAVGGPTGSLRRVFPDSSGKASKAIATDLFAPYGVAIHRGAAFVSIGTVQPTGGSVIKIPLG
jgi:hypothetical protein